MAVPRRGAVARVGCRNRPGCFFSTWSSQGREDWEDEAGLHLSEHGIEAVYEVGLVRGGGGGLDGCQGDRGQLGQQGPGEGEEDGQDEHVEIVSCEGV